MNNKYLLKLWPASVVRVTFHAPHSHIGLAGLQVDILGCLLVYLGYFYGSQLKSSPLVSRTFVIYFKLLLILS